MADQVKEHDNKDQESGRPVQLDPEQQAGTPDKPQPERKGPEPAQQPAPTRQ
ncbi:MAG TPA: hypothetical protein VF136_01070 [Methylomirabilota bacterium]